MAKASLDAPEAPTLERDWDTALAGLLETVEKPSERVIVKVYMPWVTSYNAALTKLVGAFG